MPKQTSPSGSWHATTVSPNLIRRATIVNRRGRAAFQVRPSSFVPLAPANEKAGAWQACPGQQPNRPRPTPTVPFSRPKLPLSSAAGRRSLAFRRPPAGAVPAVEAAGRGLDETFPRAPCNVTQPARVLSRAGQRSIRHNANGIRANAVPKRAKERSPRAFANRNGQRQFWTCNAKSDPAGADDALYRLCRLHGHLPAAYFKAREEDFADREGHDRLAAPAEKAADLPATVSHRRRSSP